MPEISFDDWKKINLKVGKILSVEDHPSADRLYVLKVDLGTETRTLVAGIKKYYTKDQLLNRKVIVFVNLQPAVLRGVKSEGMILAAVDETTDTVTLLQPEKDIKPGSIIR
mgnify:CR=1 FL=1